VLEIFPRYLSHHPDDARARIFLANVLARLNRIDEGKVEVAKSLEMSPDDPLMMYNAACFYAIAGEKRLAIETLKKSVNAGQKHYEWIKRDPDLDSIRNEPGYIELMKDK